VIVGEPAANGACTVAVIGGFGKKQVELYDSSTGRFRRPPHRQHFADFVWLALSDGRALCVDGRNDFLYTPAGGFVRAANHYPLAIRWPPAVLLDSGKVLFCGGYDADFKPVDHCVVFNPASATFEVVGTLRVARAQHGIVRCDDGQSVLLVGGAVGDGKAMTASIERFDVRTGAAEILDVELSAPRKGGAVVTLADGTFLCVGGQVAGKKGRAAEVVDVKNGRSIPVGALAIPRFQPVAIPLASGRIAVIGGTDDVRVIEIYAPEARRFMPARQLLHAPRRSGFTVTPLPSGAMLIVGGRPNSTSEVLAHAELLVEEPVPPDQRRAHPDVASLITALGAGDFRERRAATSALAALGRAAERELAGAAAADDPEISARARELLARLGEPGSWVVEVHRADDSVAVVEMGTAYPTSADGRGDRKLLQPLQEALKAGAATRLVVRLPGADAATTARVLNLVGLLRIADTALGDPLPGR
jgi:hypothetical protein